MHKRTLYISEESYKKVDELSKENNRSHADILRQAVEVGLLNIKVEKAAPKEEPKPILRPLETKPPEEKPVESYDPTMVIHSQSHEESTNETTPSMVASSENNDTDERTNEANDDTENKSMKKYVENQITSALHKIFK